MQHGISVESSDHKPPDIWYEGYPIWGNGIVRRLFISPLEAGYLWLEGIRIGYLVGWFGSLDRVRVPLMWEGYVNERTYSQDAIVVLRVIKEKPLTALVCWVPLIIDLGQCLI